ncbi:MAG: DUF1565 domain-containing protein [Planctomycetota bacterium]|nr:MAG: DUF1565 domain-containing protein [Planctomycetota bacterium]
MYEGKRRAALLILAVWCGGCPFEGGLDTGGFGDGEFVPDDVPQTFYVSPSGDDAADGLSVETAFKTVTRAVLSLGPGDTLLLQPGTYAEEVSTEVKGTSTAPVTIVGDGDGVVFDGQRTRGVGFWCNECAHVTIENITFRDYTDVGLIVTLSEDVTLRNLTVHGNGFAAKMSWVEGYGMHVEDSSGVVIEGCEAFDNGPNPQVLDRWLGTGIDTFNLRDSVIRNNRSHDNTGGGLLVEDSTNVLVENNELTDNDLDATVEQWWDGAVWVDGGHDITLRGNVITGNIGPGIQLSDEELQNPSGYVLEGNTVTGNLYGVYIWNFGTSDVPAKEIIDIRDENQIDGNSILDFWIVPFN